MVDSWPPINGLTEVLLQVSDRFSKLFDEAFQSASPLEKNEIVIPDLRDGASSREKDMAFKEAIESLARLDVSLDHADMEKFADFFTRLYTNIHAMCKKRFELVIPYLTEARPRLKAASSADSMLHTATSRKSMLSHLRSSRSPRSATAGMCSAAIS